MKNTFSAIALATMGLFATHASADIYTFESGGNTVGTLEITDIAGGAMFELTSSTSASFASTAFLLDLAFQGPSGTFGNYTGPGSDPIATFGTFTDGGMQYDWSVNFDNAPPGDRLLDGMTATWTITGTGLSADSFGMPMQLHIGAINGPDDSIKVPAIPEPETYALMLAGLGILGFLNRRRQRSR
jgi:hypothetical protein